MAMMSIQEGKPGRDGTRTRDLTPKRVLFPLSYSVRADFPYTIMCQIRSPR